MKKSVFTMFAVLFPQLAVAATIDLLTNGSFENNSASSTQYNMSNASFTSSVDTATAFGTSEELDLSNGSAVIAEPAAQDGSWKVGLHQKSDDATQSDAFSLELSSSLVVGTEYDLSFWGIGWDTFFSPYGIIEVGLSDAANTFGTLLFSGTIDSYSAWNEFTYNFFATSESSYLTFRVGSPYDGYAWLDNVSLTYEGGPVVVPVPASLPLSLAGIGLLGLFARKPRRKQA